MRASTCWIRLACAGVLGLLICHGNAHAGGIRGQLTLTTAHGEKGPEGLWRLDNGILAVQARSVDPRSECVVILYPKTPPHGKDVGTAEPVIAELRGLRLVPQVIVVPLGAALVIKNEDRVPYALHAVGPDEAAYPAKPLPAGAKREETLQHPGVYPLRDDEQAHLRGWVIVTDAAVVLHPDAHWAFHGDAPDGHYDLKVFYKGNFVVEKSVEISSRATELQLTIPAKHAPNEAR